MHILGIQFDSHASGRQGQILQSRWRQHREFRDFRPVDLDAPTVRHDDIDCILIRVISNRYGAEFSKGPPMAGLQCFQIISFGNQVGHVSLQDRDSAWFLKNAITLARWTS
jgi:hypothetical protein